ncbi:MAG: NADH-quinone oxidoreductase subunit L [Candidatus Micrarchaeaceae archaeon]
MLPIMIIVAPIAAMLIIPFIRNWRNVAYPPIIAAIISLALLPFISSGTNTMTWFSVGSATFQISISVGLLNMILLSIVLIIAPLIFIYSAGFMRKPSEQKRFYEEMLAFYVAMLVFAVSGSFVTLFIAWEFLSVTSYLLIGFWHGREKATTAARKAITTVLIGDIALLASMAIFWNTYGTLEFSSIIGAASAAGGAVPVPMSAIILLIIAIFTKSAQFPFHEWLPDAMEGPVPVSAFLHSSTMVKAGVFAAMLLFPIFYSSKNAMLILLAVGVATAVIAVLNAMQERHIKRIPAYSTVAELGIMLATIGIGALAAAVYFFFAQSFYKALLFFSSGVAMDATGKEDIYEISGLRHNRLIYITTLFGVLALAGFVPFDMFFANLGIGAAFSTNIVAYIIILLISMGTSFFIFRWFYLVSKREKNFEIGINYDSTPRSMKYTMLVLAAISLVTSLAYLPILRAVSASASSGISVFGAVVETVLVAAGAYIGYLAFFKGSLKINAQKLHLVVYNSVLMNSFYILFCRFAYFVGEGVSIFDYYLNDLFDWLGHATLIFGNGAKRLVNGQLSSYMLIFWAGFAVLMIYMLFIVMR